MGHVFFSLAVVAACLLWSAAFTAGAARTRPGWVVYSVGPDGEGDGGPEPPDADHVEGDDVGLGLTV